MSEVMHMLRQIGLQVKDLIRTVLTDWILCFLTFSFNKHLGGGGGGPVVAKLSLWTTSLSICSPAPRLVCWASCYSCSSLQGF